MKQTDGGEDVAVRNVGFSPEVLRAKVKTALKDRSIIASFLVSRVGLGGGREKSKNALEKLKKN